jgi:hypothetical protein
MIPISNKLLLIFIHNEIHYNDIDMQYTFCILCDYGALILELYAIITLNYTFCFDVII